MVTGTWAHFERKVDKSGERDYCKYCKSSYQVGSTGNMNQHLRKKHPDILVHPLESVSVNFADTRTSPKSRTCLETEMAIETPTSTTKKRKLRSGIVNPM